MRAAIGLALAMVVAAAGARAAAPVAVSVDFNANVRPVSPLIFGVSYGDAARNAQVGYTLVRWGGNSTSRYNWQADVHNTGNDWYFENIRDCSAPTCIGTPPAGNSADAFVGAALDAGAQPLLTIPTIGWTARADSPAEHPFLSGFSTARYGSQASTDYWDPDSGNGVCSSTSNKTGYCVSGRIVGNDPADTSTAVTPSFEQQWIAHLQATFGTASSGGVKLYALDNEVMLWNSTHRDVHPLPLDYAGAWTETHDYAAAIKQQDASAQVSGPVTWGYSDLWTSAADAASCNCLDGSDRTAHGHQPFVAWYLQQVCANPLAGGARAVDVVDLHYYPQGSNVNSDDDSATTAALRLRSLKELYDAGWTSESWIGTLDGPAGDDAQWHYTKPNLIPRVRGWIDQYCPGTRLAISEYNWGGDATASGAVAQAELLGIFAREGVDLAARWIAPAAGSKVEDAFRLFLDYDGAGGRVRGDSVAAVSNAVDQVGAYAFRDYGRRHLLLLTNKDTSSHSVAVTFAQGQAADCTLYGFDATNALHAITLSCGGGTALTVPALPPQSANLLVLPDSDGIFRDGFDI
jgi:hypothetical protein